MTEKIHLMTCWLCLALLSMCQTNVGRVGGARGVCPVLGVVEEAAWEAARGWGAQAALKGCAGQEEGWTGQGEWQGPSLFVGRSCSPERKH